MLNIHSYYYCCVCDVPDDASIAGKRPNKIKITKILINILFKLYCYVIQADLV